MNRQIVASLVLLAVHLPSDGAPQFTVHEWGTFTSVYGSSGGMLPGLEREEEELPWFVHAHDGMKISELGGPRGKGLLRPLRNVTVKMETPVIYFYSEEGFKASVEVGFAGGSISQWYPARQGGETVPVLPLPHRGKDGTVVYPPKDAGLIDFGGSKFAGSIQWDLEVLDRDPAHAGRIFRSGETTTWLRPRQPDANVLRIGSEYEKYLFYRGLGNFEMPVRFAVDAEETLHIANESGGAIPYALVFEMTPGYLIGVHELAGGIAAGGSATIRRETLFPEGSTQAMSFAEIGPHYEKMVAGLVGAGLRRDEADAMVQTWWASYFQQPGLRVFWVVPPQETERVLPMTVTPAPEELVRVLVGRSEILRPEFERQLVSESEAEKQDAWEARAQDRFGAAYAERVRQLREAPKLTSVAE